MITEYVEDYQWWRKWQKEYLYGVILILPPEPLRGQVNYFKRKYDPLGYHTCTAHISLTVPLTRPIDDAAWEELKKTAAGLKPVTIHYGPLANVLPKAPGVFLTVEPKNELENMVAVLEKAVVFQGAPPRPFPFYPHLTIAEYIDVEQTSILTEQLKDKVPQGSFHVTELDYLVPDESFRFTERGRLDLAA